MRAEIKNFYYPVVDADGDLITQTAWVGSEWASRVLVLIGGTHGVEGYAGTAVQCDFFNRLHLGAVQLPSETAVLCINALNPWGYAANRRCDDLGIDVNRNFVDFTKAPPVNRGYEKLRPVLAIEDAKERHCALEAFERNCGRLAYEVAFSGGQHMDPCGPFYGGVEAGFSRRLVEELMDHYQLSSRRLAVIDIHTGLGPYGYGEVICDHPPNHGCTETAIRWYGEACTLPVEGRSSSVPKTGLLDYAWHRIMGDESCFITLEFGTLGTKALFEILLEESNLWGRSPQASAEQKAEVAKKMRCHFYPDDPFWRESVIFRARQVCFQGLLGLSLS